MGSAPDAGPFTLTLSNLQTSSFGAAISPDSPAFAGVVSTEAFTSVTIRAGAPDPDNYYAPLISDLSFGPVPEPGTFPLASIVAMIGLLASHVGNKTRRHHENSRV